MLLELQFSIDELSEKKHDLTILLRDPSFRSRKQKQYDVVCEKEHSLLKFIDDMSAILGKQTLVQKYDKQIQQIHLKKYKLLRQKQYLDYLIETAKMVEEDKNGAQKVRQQIEDLQTQIKNLELKVHENKTRIDALQTKKIDLKCKIKELKKQTMHSKPNMSRAKIPTNAINPYII